MDLTNIKLYFDEFIKDYFPYKDNGVYSIMIDSIFNSFITDLYKNPIELTELYENNNVIVAVYDQLLVAFGVPFSLINEMTIVDKYIFINSLSDFYKYKGTVDFFKRTAAAFDDKLDIYELYIDLSDHTTDTWVLKPKLIYSHLQGEISHQEIIYTDVYNEIPSLFVSEDELTELYENNISIFPVKSNILLLDYQSHAEVSSMINLIVSTFYKIYKHNNVDIYFADAILNVSLEDIYYLWYYLLSQYYDTTWSNANMMEMVIHAADENPYSIDDLTDLMQEYNSLEDSHELARFYKRNIESIFRTLSSIEPKFSPDDMHNMLVNRRFDVISYIDTRLATYPSEDRRRQELIKVTNEIYNSLLLYSRIVLDENFLRYYDIFLNSLTQIVLNPSDCITYKLLHTFKPFHLEFLSKSKGVINVRDKFDNIYVSTFADFSIQALQHDFIAEMINYATFDITTLKQSNVVLHDTSIIDVHSRFDEHFVISEYQTKTLCNFVTDTIGVFDHFTSLVTNTFKDGHNIISVLKTSCDILQNTKLEISTEQTYELTVGVTSLLTQLTSMIESVDIDIGSSDMIKSIDAIDCTIHPITTTVYDTDDKSNVTLTPIVNSLIIQLTSILESLDIDLSSNELMKLLNIIKSEMLMITSDKCDIKSINHTSIHNNVTMILSKLTSFLESVDMDINYIDSSNLIDGLLTDTDMSNDDVLNMSSVATTSVSKTVSDLVSRISSIVKTIDINTLYNELILLSNVINLDMISTTVNTCEIETLTTLNVSYDVKTLLVKLTSFLESVDIDINYIDSSNLIDGLLTDIDMSNDDVLNMSSVATTSVSKTVSDLVSRISSIVKTIDINTYYHDDNELNDIINIDTEIPNSTSTIITDYIEIQTTP